jgi:hypothetical protein
LWERRASVVGRKSLRFVVFLLGNAGTRTRSLWGRKSIERWGGVGGEMEEELSKEELRKQLFSSLRSTGILDSLKVSHFDS